MFHEGRVIQVGTPDEIRTTKNPYVRQFIEGLSVGPIKMKLKEFEADEAHDGARRGKA
jgi:ABC-type transporter Mla maintaining outer membrane lipid asymmetry ATPase subunit MlaF